MNSSASLARNVAVTAGAVDTTGGAPDAGASRAGRWAGYVRENRAAAGQMAIQLAQVRTIAGWHGLEIADEAVFADIASGTDAERAGLAALRAAVRSGAVVGVFV